MKVSELWLREWVNPAIESQSLANILTMAGLEIEAIHPVAGEFSGVIVAQILEVHPHPEADKLSLCLVNTGKSSPLKIVCGASNVRPRLKVALAQIGASLPGDLKIKEVKLRGEISQGMLCSAAELSLEASANGILELEDNAPIGMDLRKYLTLADHIFEFDLTPNRADCLSVIGIAREIAALTDANMKRLSEPNITPTVDDNLKIHINAPKACPSYYGRVIRNINPQAVTPVWMTERLRRAGIRAIHPVVDVSNYVMLELGQPMHAFDLQTLKNSILVRFASPGEELVLLDGQKVLLNENVLVIADEEKALAMAGVMGGEQSAVQEHSTDLFLESAYFEPIDIASVIRSYSLFTDSGHRFERGVDPSIQKLALERATALLLEIVGGEAGPISSAVASLPIIQTLSFRPEKVNKLTGLDIPQERMHASLQKLGMVVHVNPDCWTIEVPSYRFDIRQEVDLIEEIMRLHGYENLPGRPMFGEVRLGRVTQEEALAFSASQLFSARAYHQIISYSFVDPELQELLFPESPAIGLLNPISPELSQMRLSLWPGLIASMTYNIHRQQTSIKLFETGVLFELKEGLVKEYPCISGLLAGERGALNWGEQTAPFDFYDIKGDLQSVFSGLNINNLAFISFEHPTLHPSQSAQIKIDGELIGWCGALHPRVMDALSLSQEVMLFELRIDLLLDKVRAPSYRPISKFPQIRRDLSLLVDNNIEVSSIETVIRQVVSQKCLKSFDIFDMYRGKTIPVGKKSLAIAMTFQEEDRTMTDTDIAVIISDILHALNEKLAITLREQS